jgi:crotonobetainyl-CoA:carnitine CoA-transferase CaiB-like acyl-CoA transferase
MSWPPSPLPATGPLAGLRVLDLSRILAGPYAAMLLGDLGADVVKVEHPLGDETRRWGPPFVGQTAAYFYTANRNRRSLTLDLKSADDQDLARSLAAAAEVVIENFMPGTTERFGLDYSTLKATNPRLVYCSITGYGITSSRGSWPALDFVMQAYAGIMGVTGASADQPLKAGVPIADMAAGLFAAIGILAALTGVRATGRGASVEVALADACACLLANQAMNHLIGGTHPQPAGNTHPSLAPYQTVPARDRDIALAATSDRQFRRLCEVVGRPELADDAQFRTNSLRVANQGPLMAELGNALSNADAATWVARLNRAGVAAALINSVEEVFSDHDIAGRLVTAVVDGDQNVAQVRSPIRIDGEPLEPRSAPPALGAHSASIRAAVAEQREVPRR